MTERDELVGQYLRWLRSRIDARKAQEWDPTRLPGNLFVEFAGEAAFEGDRVALERLVRLADDCEENGSQSAFYRVATGKVDLFEMLQWWDSTHGAQP